MKDLGKIDMTNLTKSSFYQTHFVIFNKMLNWVMNYLIAIDCLQVTLQVLFYSIIFYFFKSKLTKSIL